MSTFLKLITGAAKSNTIQFNGFFLALLAALSQSEFMQNNPDAMAILAGINAIVNLFLRFKTKKPVSER